MSPDRIGSLKTLNGPAHSTFCLGLENSHSIVSPDKGSVVSLRSKGIRMTRRPLMTKKCTGFGRWVICGIIPFFFTRTRVYQTLRGLFSSYKHSTRVRESRGAGIVGKHNLR